MGGEESGGWKTGISAGQEDMAGSEMTGELVKWKMQAEKSFLFCVFS